MADSSSTQSSSGLDQNGRRRIVQVTVTILVMTGIYFLSAGSLYEFWGWFYLGLSIVLFAIGGVYVLKINPQAINERGRRAEGQKSWDKIVVLLGSVLYIFIYIVAGLDARFSWSDVPLWLHLVGAAGMIAGSLLTYAAMAHNKFLSMFVQVSQQRGHQVATGGPYRSIRHPMYLSLVLSWPALALLLGSYWALLPAICSAVLIVVRTSLEDRTLQTELPGYAEYARQVRYRLLPGIW